MYTTVIMYTVRSTGSLFVLHLVSVWYITDLTEGSIDQYGIPGIVLIETISGDPMLGLAVITGETTVAGKEGVVYIETTDV